MCFILGYLSKQLKKIDQIPNRKKNYFAQISCKHVNMKSHVNVLLIIEILKRHLDDG